LAVQVSKEGIAGRNCDRLDQSEMGLMVGRELLMESCRAEGMLGHREKFLQH
jgi:hypothetical protein